ncbi:hypothetical protein [Amycolatopsis nalaikhensis]|uniref:Uncharacterized protein n=1 Tax=Amycolatopsis nalaikhensis TaxID=715472 RepID=A0ABY8XHX3_9PSEU|nr:hypothetical protein [Amycolatopsis sp. 2-2]WIV55223.1 hypothetical protein QP939_41405 [Amycolatopsis sp. 2-2]
MLEPQDPREGRSRRPSTGETGRPPRDGAVKSSVTVTTPSAVNRQGSSSA